MRTPRRVFVAAFAALNLVVAGAASAQTTVISPVAPGTDLPTGVFGGIGAGGVAVAPGAAMGGNSNLERIGPGGSLIAPGPAGGLGGPALPSAPAELAPPIAGSRVR